MSELSEAAKDRIYRCVSTAQESNILSRTLTGEALAGDPQVFEEFRQPVNVVHFRDIHKADTEEVSALAIELFQAQQQYTRNWKGAFFTLCCLMLSEDNAQADLIGLIKVEIGQPSILPVTAQAGAALKIFDITTHVTKPPANSTDLKEMTVGEEHPSSLASWIAENPAAHPNPGALPFQMMIAALLSLGRPYNNLESTALQTRLDTTTKLCGIMNASFPVKRYMIPQFLTRANTMFCQCPKIRQFMTRWLLKMSEAPQEFFVGSTALSTYVLKMLEGSYMTHLIAIETHIVRKYSHVLMEKPLVPEVVAFTTFRELSFVSQKGFYYWKLICGHNKDTGVSTRDLPLLGNIAKELAIRSGTETMGRYVGAKVSDKDRAVITEICDKCIPQVGPSILSRTNDAVTEFHNLMTSRKAREDAERARREQPNAPILE